MLDQDRKLIEDTFSTIKTRHSPDPNEINPYTNLKQIQHKCKHMWPNDTDAIYTKANGKRKCAICGKEF